MAVANGTPYNTRSLVDANFVMSVALPNAANSVNTNAVNLVQSVPYPVTEKFIVDVNTSAATAANSKNINVVLQHTGALSNGAVDTTNYANIPQFSTWVTTGNTTAHANATRQFLLPPDVKQFVRAQATGEANGGDSSDGTLTLRLLF